MENLDPFSPPNREDEKMARFGFRSAYISLISGVEEGGACCSILFCPDCSQYSPLQIDEFRYILNRKIGAEAWGE